MDADLTARLNLSLKPKKHVIKSDDDQILDAVLTCDHGDYHRV